MRAAQPPPSIEILLPYVGSETYLREAVTSVLTQSDGEWKLTVVEDGPQGTGVGEWLASLGDPRVLHVLNPETLGVSRNFQRCLDLATSDYVVFLGCDDRLAATYVSTMRAASARHPDAAVIQPSVRVIDEHGSAIHPLPDRVKSWLAPHGEADVTLRGARLLSSLLRGNWTYFPSLLWQRRPLKAVGFREDLTVAPDLVALAELVLVGHSLVVTQDEVFEYRRHSRSVSSLAATGAERFAEERRVLHQLGSAADRAGWTNAALAARCRPSSRLHAVLMMVAAARRGDGQAFTACARHAFGA